MNNYYKITTIMIRGLALYFVLTALIDFGLIGLNFLFIKTGVLYHDQIAAQPRTMYAAFDIIAAAFLYFKSDFLADHILTGLDDDQEFIDEKVETIETE